MFAGRMTGVDWLIVAVILFSAVVAASHGFFYEIFSLCRSGSRLSARGLGIWPGGALVLALREDAVGGPNIRAGKPPAITTAPGPPVPPAK